MSKYTPFLPFVKENIATLSYDKIADRIGCSVPALRQQLKRWRKNGLITTKSSYRPKATIGEVRQRNERGVTVEWIKTENGWERIKKPTAPKKKTPKKEVVKKTDMVVRTDGNRRRKKKVERVFETRKQDLTNKTTLYIPELRMTVYVSKDANVTEVRRKYLDQREFNLKKI